MKRTLILAFGVVLVLAGITAGSAGCVRRVPRPIADRGAASAQNVALAGAKSVDLRVEMGAGELTVKSTDSTESAVAGEFDYSPANLKPKVTSSIEGTTQRVRITQPDADFEFGSGSMKNEWTLSLPEGIPAKLAVTLGAGKGKLDMRKIDLTELSVQQGAGDLSLDLSDQNGDLAVMATLGAGEATFRVPVGVAVVYDDHDSGLGDLKADGFVEQPDGTWVNGAWAKANSYAGSSTTTDTIRLNVTRGLGDVRIITVD